MTSPLRAEAPLPPLPNDQDASGRSFGPEHVELLRQVVESGVLTSTKGTFVKQLEQGFMERCSVRHASACASGTAAVHIAVAAIDPEPGDEIVTTPITDMGALSPILYQGAIPVFADVDPATLNVTAETIAARISDRTRAILVTHLFGNPCEMTEIMALANERNIPVIEDCAQAYLAESQGRLVGTIGSIGCFSLQQGKHITSGEGGLVVTNDDALGRRMRLLINKAWGYGDPSPDHYFLALNYRLSELQGAIAFAQLETLDANVGTRSAMAARLDARLSALEGISTPEVRDGDTHAYWRYALRVNGDAIPGGSPAVGAALGERAIASAPRYIQKPAFQCEVFEKQRTFGESRYPFTLARPEAVDYAMEGFPGVARGLEEVLVLPWNERYADEHIDRIADAIEASVGQLREGGR